MIGGLWWMKLAALAAVVGGLWWAEGAVEQRGFDRATRERAARDATAVEKKLTANVVEVAAKAAANTKIEGDAHEKLQPVITRIVTQRVRVGTGICPVAAVAESQSTSNSPEANPPGRLVRPDVERDIRALKMAVEEDLATGRACQEKLRVEGLLD